MQATNDKIFSRTYSADITTPILAYTALRSTYPYAVLLESLADQESLGRFSHIGFDVMAEISVTGCTISSSLFSDRLVPADEVLNTLREFYHAIRTCADDPRVAIVGGLVGYINYETIGYFEKIPLKNSPEDGPTLHLQSFRYGLTFDHQTQEMIISVRVKADTTDNQLQTIMSTLLQQIKDFGTLAEMNIQLRDHSASSQPATPDLSDEDFKQHVDTAKKHIIDGDIFQVVLSRTFAVPFTADPLTVYRALRFFNPSPYLFYLPYAHRCLVGASPEKCVSVHNGLVEVNPLAGTRQRSESGQDSLLEVELANDSKECAEHMMLVDLARNDLGRIAVPGTVKVKNLLQIKKARHVMHLSSQVQARVGETFDAFDAIKATFPAGTLSGAPKIRAMEIIHDLEATPRLQYGGAIVLLDGNHHLESCIAIRMARIENQTAYVRTGAGIVHDSDPQKEADETRIKARSILQAIHYARGE